MEIQEVTLNNVKLNHDIVVPGYRGKTTHVLIFQDKDANTYYWVTSSGPTLFEEGHIYNIKAKLDRTRGNRLSYLKLIDQDVKPKREQPDAEDILLGLASY